MGQRTQKMMEVTRKVEEGLVARLDLAKRYGPQLRRIVEIRKTPDLLTNRKAQRELDKALIAFEKMIRADAILETPDKRLLLQQLASYREDFADRKLTLEHKVEDSSPLDDLSANDMKVLIELAKKEAKKQALKVRGGK